jgi:hypothetical protein
MTRLIAIAVSAALLVPATTAMAQTCLGTASFAAGPVRVGAGLDFSEDATQYSAQLAFGQAAGIFASAGVGKIDVDEIDESATTFALNLGYSFAMAGTQSLEICPIVSYGYASADIGEGGVSVDFSDRQLGAGFAIGGVASSTPTFKLVPSLTLAYVHEDLEFEGDFEFEDSEDFGVITVAAGFVFSETVTLRPNISFPVGLDDSDPAFGIAFSFNFGARPASR